MKTKLYFLLFLVIAFGCNSNKINTVNVSNMLTSGSWRIIYFTNEGHNATQTFSGYSFTFSDAQVVSAHVDTSVVDGSWLIEEDDEGTHVILDFQTNEPLDQLNYTWHVLGKTPTELHMNNINDVTGEANYLNIMRN
jgi:hypothetical protein